MRLKLTKASLILVAMLFCLNCNSKPVVSNSESKSLLSSEILAKLGYEIKGFDEAPPDKWLKEQFQTVWTRTYKVKSQASLKEQADMFPRYIVTEEVYDTENLAAERLKRIQEKPPDLPIEDREYWMVTGFQYQNNIYFIRTDAAAFYFYIKDFADKLAEEIKK